MITHDKKSKVVHVSMDGKAFKTEDVDKLAEAFKYLDQVIKPSESKLGLCEFADTLESLSSSNKHLSDCLKRLSIKANVMCYYVCDLDDFQGYQMVSVEDPLDQMSLLRAVEEAVGCPVSEVVGLAASKVWQVKRLSYDLELNAWVV